MTEAELKESEVQTKMALCFCIGASLLLVLLYALMKYIIVFEVFLALLGAASCSTFFTEVVHTFAPCKAVFSKKAQGNEGQRVMRSIRIPGIGRTTFLDLAGITVGLSIAGYWLLTFNWILNNVLAVALCWMFLKSARLNRLVPGLALLILLFIYDVFWVYYSSSLTGGHQSVMIAVATSFQAPIKIMMPRISGWGHPLNSCSMLGLADIIIPGLFIGFIIRFGGSLVASGQEKRNPYTCPIMFAYLVALLTCAFFLFVHKSA